MSDYWVRLPIAGVLAVNVEADNEEAAIEAAFKADWSVNVEGANIELEELDTFEHICQGNVLHVNLNEPEVEDA